MNGKWQSYLPIPLILLNVDTMVVAMRGFNLFEGFSLAVVGSSLAIITSGLWYYFFSFIAKSVKGPGKEILGTKTARYLFRYDRFIKGNSLGVRMIRFFSYIGLFLICFIPEPGTRLGGAAYCGLRQSRLGLFFLTSGNVAKTILVAYGANWLFS